ncbi:hemerythrin [Shewanella sairae]|uniref:Hemerythrin n=1 Tax=Shewanella sairae TaxID=190310 RepID=A0ABQ4PR47_9GAMM|nr:hemerythrin domain-containing protein [Shewanella sairae]MCL1128637.1 hemerythrin domain-containing protein [Shewanella sairae]GIU51932.1 hemerythrin [Shewanella sairae]
MLARLMHDHKHITILLKVLTDKHTKLAAGEAINYNVVRDIVEYMQSYAEHSHHPLEEVIDEFYRDKVGSEQINQQLTDEHERLGKASSSLMATLNLILSDIVVSKEQLINDLISYVNLQETHMQFEETVVFPKWREVIADNEWQNVRKMCQARLVDDPLFNESDSALFEELREYLDCAD